MGVNPLISAFTSHIRTGLARKSVTTPSRWAESYRIMGMPFPGLYSFKYHPWARRPHDCDAPYIIVQKAAQMGFTEMCLNKTFYQLDILGNSVLYILPAMRPGAADFSNSRFNPAIESSEHIKNMFTDTKNIGHKRAGRANLLIRGSRSKTQLKSDPVSLIVMDEVDEFVQENIELAEERISGQKEHQIIKVSTPTVQDIGINRAYSNSTQEHFFFKCPHCGQMTELTFPDCIVITCEDFTHVDIQKTHYICSLCKGVLDHDKKTEWLKDAEWVKSKPTSLYAGFHINQMYSMVVKPYELATLYLKARTNPAAEQEFFNSKLGLVHETKGARITAEDLVNCTGNYTQLKTVPGDILITMGIDIGKTIHYEIVAWSFKARANDINTAAHGTVVRMGTVNEFEELDDIIKKYNAVSVVVDSQPERRKSLELVRRFPGICHACVYSRGQDGADIKVGKELIMVSRTMWLDTALSRFRDMSINIPVDAPVAYKEHMKALVRLFEKNTDGSYVSVYKNTGDDHFGHARCYSEIALRLVKMGANRDIRI